MIKSETKKQEHQAQVAFALFAIGQNTLYAIVIKTEWICSQSEFALVRSDNNY